MGVLLLPKACCWRISRFGHSCSQCSTVCGSSMHSGHAGSAAGFDKRAYALSSVVCHDNKWTRRTASARFEVALQSAVQERFYVHYGRSGPAGWRISDGVWTHFLPLYYMAQKTKDISLNLCISAPFEEPLKGLIYIFEKVGMAARLNQGFSFIRPHLRIFH